MDHALSRKDKVEEHKQVYFIHLLKRTHNAQETSKLFGFFKNVEQIPEQMKSI